MANKTQAQLIIDITNLILSGRSNTTAANLRLILTEMVQSYPNIADTEAVYDNTNTLISWVQRSIVKDSIDGTYHRFQFTVDNTGIINPIDLGE
jgi:hypothetical protein